MEFLGGCQCGRVRYCAEGPAEQSSVCYCRMCQKASGGPFMAFVRFPVRQVAWSSPPAVFASSNMVERGFCRECGTPLTYREINGPAISLTLNSLDNPDAVPPKSSFVTERKAQWLCSLDALPQEQGDLTNSPGFVSYQAS